MRRLWNHIVHVLSGEWLLDGQPNGGDIIIARSLFSAVSLYFLFIGLKHFLDPSRTWSFDSNELRKEIHSSIPVFGALLAAIYATLYTRFAAQWSYLAGLYNQILKAEIDLADTAGSEKKQALAYWKASFIEDADELHLSTKRIFVPAIRDWLSDSAVRECFVEGALGGQPRLQDLEARLSKVRPVT